MSRVDQNGARGFFRSAAEDYEAVHYGSGVRSLMSVRLERILELVDGLGLAPGSPSLDAGCGPGHLAEALTARGLAVRAVDTSAAMLERTRAKLRAAGAPSQHLALASIDELPHPDASFDLVCSAGVIEYLPADAKALAELFRVLRPGGRAILPVTNLWSPAGYLDFLVESLKRRAWLLAPLNRMRARRGHPPIRARRFPVRRHRPAGFRRSLREAGFELERDGYFYMLPWPHPFDRLFPRSTARLGALLEPLCRGPLGGLAEGYVALVRRPDR